MKCTNCGAGMKAIRTDLPFKTTERAIVILREVPVHQCEGCGHFLLDDVVLERVDKLLAGISDKAELEIVRYAAETRAEPVRCSGQSARGIVPSTRSASCRALPLTIGVRLNCEL